MTHAQPGYQSFTRCKKNSLRASSPIWASEASLARTRERGAPFHLPKQESLLAGYTKKDYIYLGDHISPTAQKRSVWALRFIFIICLYFPGASRPSTTLKPTLSTGSTLMSRIARESRDPVTPAPSSSPSQSKTNSLTTPSKRRLPRGKHDLIANLRFPLYGGPPFRVKGHTKKKLT